MSTPVQAEIYTLQMADSDAPARYVVFLKTRLGARQFVGLMREEVFDQTCACPAKASGLVIADEAMLWAEESSDGLLPLSPEEIEVLEDLFQEKLIFRLRKDLEPRTME